MDLSPGHVLITLKRDRVSSSCIKHERVPSFASGAAHEKEEGICEVLEVGVFGHIAFEFDHGEELHPDDAIHELEEEEEDAKATHSWGSCYQSLEDDLQLA